MSDVIRTGGDRIIENPIQGGSLILRTTAVGGAKNDAVSISGSGVMTAPAQPPIGSIVSYSPGYFTNGSNGGFTRVGPATNTVAGVNSYLPGNWRVCDGSALNDPDSPIWVGASRFLPNLTDSRFLMGSTAAGTTGGANTVPHTHSVTSNVTVSAQPTFTVPDHYHGKGTLNITSSGAHTHTYSTTTPQYITAGTAWTDTGTGYDSYTATMNSSGAHTHPSSNFAGSVGSTGGANGDVDFAATRTTNVALANAAVTSEAASDSENRPLHLTAFYIIRVK